ncbi:uncharacterized protein B0H18DRAFT_1031432 [Fomitopsis serialis]|uniref:uncharacterized protein n=1 Tax=Fomitopsis serialis TaxID=139415 RepID=UPI0020084958|nr:uncharacterized protein B0H18DRAFT_1031432 [Neoantrodia serialis]KAH9918292.1 hypothetical protein B0H18DRAFT_1031432 [Neoantrodia serialis]
MVPSPRARSPPLSAPSYPRIQDPARTSQCTSMPSKPSLVRPGVSPIEFYHDPAHRCSPQSWATIAATAAYPSISHRGDDSVDPPSSLYSSSSISNPAELAVECPDSSNGRTPHVSRLLHVPGVLAWVVGGAAFLGFVGMSLGQTVRRRTHTCLPESELNIQCARRVGAAGAAVLSLPLYATYLSVSRALARRAPHPLVRRWPLSSACLLQVCKTLLFVSYGAASGAAGWAILRATWSRGCDMSDIARAAGIGALGWFLLSLVCVVCENVPVGLSVAE